MCKKLDVIYGFDDGRFSSMNIICPEVMKFMSVLDGYFCYNRFDQKCCK